MSATAKQIVAKMLEDHAGEFEDRAGGPKDMWRQGGFKKFNLKGQKFTGKRPGETDKPEPEEDEDEKPPKVQAPNRFKWKVESLLHELGGHYCTGCKRPTAGSWDESKMELACTHCGQPLKYNNEQSRDPVPPPNADATIG